MLRKNRKKNQTLLFFVTDHKVPAAVLAYGPPVSAPPSYYHLLHTVQRPIDRIISLGDVQRPLSEDGYYKGQQQNKTDLK
ncbi:MAG TPA: hypothetical protein VK017_04350 [Sphingobacterium sp.]|jgi:hypothetical protein|nr:hypothetical protein [Sphingobacterium sp.]